MERSKYKKLLYSSVVVVALFAVQVFAGKSGRFVADLFSYKQFDYSNIYAWVSVHHIVQMVIILVIIAILTRLLKIDFGFTLGDRKKGMKYLIIFTAIIAVFALMSNIFMYINKQLPEYDFPLNAGNILGTLGFQLFLSGTSEEILFRALPITVLVYVFGKSIKLKWHFTLEVIIASLFFSIAHANWTLIPFTFEADYFQLFYAFALGTIQGIVYQESRSIVYPMLMHSISNVLMVGTGYIFSLL